MVSLPPVAKIDMGIALELWPAIADPDLTHRLRAFVRERVVPVAHDLDARDLYPTDIIRATAAEGWNSLTLPLAYGGGGGSYHDAAAICEEIGYGSAGVAISLITIFQAQTMISLFGADSLKSRYLPRFASGLIASYALTEASHGSDIRQLDTRAERAPDGGWILTGEKSFITSGVAAELLVILAQTDVGVSAFAVPREVEGVSTEVGPNSETFGLRNGPHVNIRLEAVRLPDDHLIGTEGKGVRQAVTVLDYSRTLAAAISVGIARAALDGAIAFAAGRRAFDRNVIDFQGIQWYLAEMLTDIDAARLLVFRAAGALDTHDNVMRHGSEAKLFASRIATEVCTRAVQICGAYGTMTNAPFGRYLRDAKTYEIGGGSSEILKNTIAKVLLKMLEART